MKNLKKQYRDLEMSVLSSLRDKVLNSKIKSKHVQGNAIKVNIFGNTELVIINDTLTFLDDNGLHYSLFGDCSLEDLIDIINTPE
jgi:hypothetical protein